MKTKYGKPKICENCGVTNSARYEWAKLPDYDYDFKKENFIRLCKSCHVRMDMANDENWAINISNGLKNVYLNKPNLASGYFSSVVIVVIVYLLNLLQIRMGLVDHHHANYNVSLIILRMLYLLLLMMRKIRNTPHPLIHTFY